MKRLVAMTVLLAGALFAGSILTSEQASARTVRHRRLVARRVWVGRRIVVGRPVVVTPVVINGVAHGVIDFDVEPDSTKVYVDGEMRGQVDDFDGAPGKLHLRPGRHLIRLTTEDGDSWTERIRVVAGNEINIKLEMDR